VNREPWHAAAKVSLLLRKIKAHDRTERGIIVLSVIGSLGALLGGIAGVAFGLKHAGAFRSHETRHEINEYPSISIQYRDANARPITEKDITSTHIA
jgi:hypothetical protein